MALIKLRITILLGAFARVRENQKEKRQPRWSPLGIITRQLNYTPEVLWQQLFSGMQPDRRPQYDFGGTPRQTLHRHEGSRIL
jgi:hypothetical protein